MKVIFERKGDYQDASSSISRKNKSIMSDSGSFSTSLCMNPIIRHFELIECSTDNCNQLFALKEELIETSKLYDF